MEYELSSGTVVGDETPRLTCVWANRCIDPTGDVFMTVVMALESPSMSKSGTSEIIVEAGKMEITIIINYIKQKHAST